MQKYVYIVLFLFSSVVFLTQVDSRELKRIKRYVRKTNKGYLGEFGKIVAFIKSRKDLKTKLKLSAWLNKVIKLSILKNNLKELRNDILKDHLMRDFFNIIRNNKLCILDRITSILDFEYDSIHDILFIKFYYGTTPQIECSVKNIHVIDEALYKRYDSTRSSLGGMIYKYKGKIYIYINGEKHPTNYTNVHKTYFSDDYTRYALLFDDKKGRGININGKEYRVGKKCFDFYIDKTFMRWALICGSKKFTNKVFVKHGNNRKFLFSYIHSVYLNGDGIFYIGYNQSYNTGRTTGFYAVANSKVHKRYNNRVILEGVYPFDKSGRRWIYVISPFSLLRPITIMMDTDNILTREIAGSSSYYIISSDNPLAFYISKKKDNKWGLFKNKHLILDFLRSTTGNQLIPRYGSPAIVVSPDKKYLVLLYHTAQERVLNGDSHIILFGKRKIKKYKFKNQQLYLQTLKQQKNKYIFSLYDYRGSVICFEIKNLRISKIKDIFCNIYGNFNKENTNISSRRFSKHVENIISFTTHTVPIKNILFLIGSQNSYPPLYSFLVVSLTDYIDVIYKFKLATLIYNRYTKEIIFFHNDGLYRVSLKKWVHKSLTKVRNFCKIQKKLCRGDSN